MVQEYDVVVVGMGLMGSSALYTLSTRGIRALGLEQFSSPHCRGSSHGHTRIIRYAYQEEHYSKMAIESWKRWEKVEQEANTTLIVKTGSLDFGPPSSLQNVRNSLVALNVPHEILSKAGIEAKYPGVRVPDNFIAVTTKDAGIIQANKTVGVLQELAKRRGSEVWDCRKLQHVQELASGKLQLQLLNTLTKETESVVCQKLILCPGAWLSPMLSSFFRLQIHTTVMKMGYKYFKAKDPATYDYTRFPVFICYSGEEKDIYGTPSFELPGVLKVGVHHFGDISSKDSFITSADGRDFSYDKGLESILQSQVASFFPGLDLSAPANAETCLYTVTKGDNFIFDLLPSNPNIVVGGGGSGHAFKHGTIIGEILADLALLGKSEWQIDLFKFEHHLLNSKM